MSYSNHFTGEITITPPLTWAEIRTGPKLQDTSLHLIETVTDSETGRTVETQAIGIIAESGFSGFRVADEIQFLVNHHGASHAFAGHIEVQFEHGLVEVGQPGCERYVVIDGRVETVTPRLVWPGDERDAPITREQIAAEVEAYAESIGWYEGGGVWADAIAVIRREPWTIRETSDTDD